MRRAEEIRGMSIKGHLGHLRVVRAKIWNAFQSPVNAASTGSRIQDILSVIKFFENSGYPVVVATGFIPGDPGTRRIGG